MERPRARNSINKLPSILSMAGRKRTGHAPKSQGSSQKNVASRAPRKKRRAFFWRNIHLRENVNLFRKFQAIFLRKTLYPGPQLSLTPLPLNTDQLSKELQWLMRQNECLVKIILNVSCMKIQGGNPPCSTLPTHMSSGIGHLVFIRPCVFIVYVLRSLRMVCGENKIDVRQLDHTLILKSIFESILSTITSQSQLCSN